MTGRNVEQIKEALVADYRKNFPGEPIYGKVFSIYLLEKHAKLLYKLFKKAEQKEQ